MPGYYLAREINKIQAGSIDGKISVLDIGTGEGRPWEVASEFLRTKLIELTAIDSHTLSTETHGFSKCGSPYPLKLIVGNLLDLLKQFADDSFDFVVSLDVIEHLAKEDGYRMLYEMNRISSKGFAVSCPVGFLWQPPEGRNVMQAHISGWTPSEFRRMGFSLVNTWHGLRILTGPFYQKKYSLNYLTSPFYLMEVAIGKLLPFAASGLWAYCDRKLPQRESTPITYTEKFLFKGDNDSSSE